MLLCCVFVVKGQEDKEIVPASESAVRHEVTLNFEPVSNGPKRLRAKTSDGAVVKVGGNYERVESRILQQLKRRESVTHTGRAIQCVHVPPKMPSGWMARISSSGISRTIATGWRRIQGQLRGCGVRFARFLRRALLFPPTVQREQAPPEYRDGAVISPDPPDVLGRPLGLPGSVEMAGREGIRTPLGVRGMVSRLTIPTASMFITTRRF